MQLENKIKYESERLETDARAAIANWKTCPFSQLVAAAEVFDSAIFLLIQRMAVKSEKNQ